MKTIIKSSLTGLAVILISIAALSTHAMAMHDIKPAELLIARAYELANFVKRDQQNGARVDFLSIEIVKDGSDLLIEMGGSYGFCDICPNHTVKVYLNPILMNKSVGEQMCAIFHELAHAYDQHYRTGNAGFECYPHLKIYAEGCHAQHGIPLEGMRASEWYADWQATQWIKKYAPENVEALKRHYEKFIEGHIESNSARKYPPHGLILLWLS